jgi:alcohol dehydrogenase class IV
MTLREIGVPEDALEADALHALADTATLFNARPVSDPAEVLGLLREAF